jgi:hypothetical protein
MKLLKAEARLISLNLLTTHILFIAVSVGRREVLGAVAVLMD